MEIRRILVTIVGIIALMALPSTAGADALVLIRLEGLFFTDPGAPPDPTMLASESFAFSVTISGSVQWDNVTHAQVPGTADFSRQETISGEVIPGDRLPFISADFPSGSSDHQGGDFVQLSFFHNPFAPLLVFFPTSGGILLPGEYPTDGIFFCQDGAAHCRSPVHASAGTQSVATIPEPATALLLLVGLLALLAWTSPQGTVRPEPGRARRRQPRFTR